MTWQSDCTLPFAFLFNSFPITVSKINSLSLFVKSYSVYLHPIQCSSTQRFASILLHAQNASSDPLFLVSLQAQAPSCHSIYILKATTLVSLK